MGEPRALFISLQEVGGSKPGDTQGLILALYAGTTPYGLGGPYGVPLNPNQQQAR